MISTKQFHWSPEQRALIADASDLGNLQMIQAYPDAADLGFDLVSARTGRVVRMVQSADCIDKDGEGYWEFIPANLRDRRAYDFKVLVFND